MNLLQSELDEFWGDNASRVTEAQSLLRKNYEGLRGSCHVFTKGDTKYTARQVLDSVEQWDYLAKEIGRAVLVQKNRRSHE